jgi:hypothetical protein
MPGQVFGEMPPVLPSWTTNLFMGGPSVNATTIWLATRVIDRLTKLNCKNVVPQSFPE